MDWIVANKDGLIAAALAAFALLAAVAAVTPTDKDDNVVERIRNILGSWLPAR
jgi:predicted porin